MLFPATEMIAMVRFVVALYYMHDCCICVGHYSINGDNVV
jgi:hypothetical protein